PVGLPDMLQSIPVTKTANYIDTVAGASHVTRITDTTSIWMNCPLLGIRCRHLNVERASMPKATIHENGNALPGKDEVGLLGQFERPAPSRDLRLLQESAKGDLGGKVPPAAHARHDL